MRRVERRRGSWRRRWPFYLAGLGAGLLAWSAIGASGGVPDPTASTSHLSHGAVLLDSGLLVFREGLETILVIAAVTASMLGANSVATIAGAAGCSTGPASTRRGRR
jgi:high-affinity iron transporter